MISEKPSLAELFQWQRVVYTAADSHNELVNCE